MSYPPEFTVAAPDPAALAALEGHLAIALPPDGKLDKLGRKLNALTRKALERLTGGRAWEKLSEGDVVTLAWPGGLAAEALHVAKLSRKPAVADLRKAGGAIAAAVGEGALTVHLGKLAGAPELALGIALRAYRFDRHRSEAAGGPLGPVTLWCDGGAELSDAMARVRGVALARDLVNEPSNVLTTTDFAERLVALEAHGLEVQVLDEAKLAELGMGALLAVGQGSDSPSKVVVMEWKGGGDAAPVALVGKGVVFDTGGISIKPSKGMEEMTMDMGGAATVAGAMLTLALRGAKANVVGLVGLVENMPSGNAYRPGDVLKSMKGDTIEVISTDAEGRLVLADVLWYAQETYAPAAIVDLATLTGAVIASLGDEMTGLFANDDALAEAITAAGRAEGEACWRLPLDPAYDRLLKSRVADMVNSAGKPPGAIVAAQFLKRFVKEGQPWVHLDIAGTATKSGSWSLGPRGGTGWGVLTLDRWIEERA